MDIKPVFIAAGFVRAILGACDKATAIPLLEAQLATGAALVACAKDGIETLWFSQNSDLVQRFS